MCDMQKMPSRDDMACDEEDMNFAAFTALGAGGTHFVTAGGQIPVTKLQQTMANNGNMQQVVGMVGSVNMSDGVQYMRPLEGGATLQGGPQLISVPIALPGAKPGDPQPTVQIQVLNPGLLQAAQPQQKYQMQIPIQGFQQGGGAVLTVQYSPETNEAGGIQVMGNTMPEGLQVVTSMPQEMQPIQPSQVQVQSEDTKHTFQHQVFITPTQQILINSPDDNKLNNNTTTNNNNGITSIVIKEECEEIMDDESSQGGDVCDSLSWQMTPSSHQDLVNYLHQLTPQQAQQLPLSLQQFLKLNPPPGKSEPREKCEPQSDDKSDNVPEMTSEKKKRVSRKKKKGRKKLAKPTKQKPGQVIIATSADGTPIFCCPECQNAYSEKEQLELHLAVHKIERRYICGICGAGLKRKEHLERHKLGHNPDRPYVCGICRKGFKRREHLNLHTVIHSGVKTEMCTECGKGFYRKDHLRKHMRSHETKRVREEQSNPKQRGVSVTAADGTILNNITIHVPTSTNVQLPVQINIPQHVVTSMSAAHHNISNNDAQMQLDALLAQHS